MPHATTYAHLLDRVITDGLTAVHISYAADPHKLRGAIEGFEACRHKTVAEIVTHYAAAERAAREALQRQSEDYERYRCAALEIEWVLNVLSVGAIQLGCAPILAHLPTTRATLKYAEIVGVLGTSQEEPRGVP